MTASTALVLHTGPTCSRRAARSPCDPRRSTQGGGWDVGHISACLSAGRRRVVFNRNITAQNGESGAWGPFSVRISDQGPFGIRGLTVLTARGPPMHGAPRSQGRRPGAVHAAASVAGGTRRSRYGNRIASRPVHAPCDRGASRLPAAAARAADVQQAHLHEAAGRAAARPADI